MVLGVEMTANRFVYEKVINAIMDMIRTEHYAPGDKLPGVRDLAERFDCNLHTVRKAIAFLEEDGLIEPRGRLGNFVCGSTNHLIGQSRSRVQIVSTRRIGVLLSTDANEFSTNLLAAVENYAVRNELQLELHAVSAVSEIPAAVQKMKRNCCRCAVFLWSGGDKTDKGLKSFLKDNTFPVVLPHPVAGYEKYCYEPAELYSWFDRKAVSFQFLYFKMLGYEHIACLGRDTASWYCRWYEEIARREGCSPDIALNTEIFAVLKRWEPYRGKLAVCCFDDLDALQLTVGAWKRGWVLPRDMALMGINNFPFARHLDPALSSILFPYNYLAERMLKRALELAAGQTEFPPFETAPLEVVIRQSCGGRTRLPEKDLQQSLEKFQIKVLPDK